MKLSNWGRWGENDERGTLNLLTPEIVRRAAGLVKTGKVYSLPMPREAEGPQWPTRHKTWRVTTFRSPPGERGSADDVVTMHSHSGTHMDALCHVWYDNQLYNGYNATEHVTSAGTTRNAIDKVPHIVGRGLLLDVAGWKGVDHLQLGEVVTAADLDACAAAQGVTVQPGDLLLVRTGWIRIFGRDRALYNQGEPGIDESTIPWLKEHDIVAVGADNQAVEVLAEIPPPRLPVHAAAIRDLGLYLLENLNLDAMAADKVYESLLVVAPLQLTGAVGSPINPIALA
ncbi:MAG TPA: cyclase family protein [Caldilineaceae bacterium]|nr:cyclase family protein [Caldilineaceae bacterium]